MTGLHKPVRRRTLRPYDHRGRRLVVTLEPPDAITIREERTRSSFTAPVAAVYQRMLVAEAERKAREKRLARKLKSARRP